MQELTLRFISNGCYKCGFTYYICYVLPQQKDKIEYKDIFNPSVIEKIKQWHNENKHIALGTIKERFSKRANTSYMSFGCPKCDAIFGDFYFVEAVFDTLYDKQGSDIANVAISL